MDALPVDASRARILELDTASHDWRAVASFDVEDDTSSWLDADDSAELVAPRAVDRAERELGRRLLERLEGEHAAGSFTRLLVVAPSSLLDRLLDDASPALRAAVLDAVPPHRASTSTTSTSARFAVRVTWPSACHVA